MTASLAAAAPDTGDVMAAQLVDIVAGGATRVGDTIEMGRYPSDFEASGFGDWNVTSHPVTVVPAQQPGRVDVESAGRDHT